MRLIACQSCHAQYDTTDLPDGEFPCRCGATLVNRDLAGVNARILRCGSCGAAVQETAEDCEYCGSPIVRDTRRLSLICPECYARNEEETRFCTACGVAFRPQPVEVDGATLACPACKAEMPPHHIGGIAVNECPECSGLWVPKRNFSLLINRAIDACRQRAASGYEPPQMRVSRGNPVSRKVEYRRCPECGEFMARRNFRGRSGVVTDSCPAHGTWLDADELEQIAGFILSGGVGLQPVAASAGPVPGGSSSTQVPPFSRRTFEILAEHEARKSHKRPREGSVLGFLMDILDT